MVSVIYNFFSTAFNYLDLAQMISDMKQRKMVSRPEFWERSAETALSW